MFIVHAHHSKSNNALASAHCVIFSSLIIHFVIHSFARSFYLLQSAAEDGFRFHQFHQWTTNTKPRSKNTPFTPTCSTNSPPSPPSTRHGFSTPTPVSFIHSNPLHLSLHFPVLVLTICVSFCMAGLASQAMFCVSQPNLLTNKRKKSIVSASLLRQSDATVAFHWAPFPIELTGVSAMVPSPSASKLLIVRNPESEGPCRFEIWSSSQLEKEFHVPQSKHGSVYIDGW